MNSIILFFFLQYVIVNNSSFKYHPRYILNKDYNYFPLSTNKQAEKKKRKEMQMEKERGRERKREKQGREGSRERRKEGKKESKDQESLGNKYFFYSLFSLQVDVELL